LERTTRARPIRFADDVEGLFGDGPVGGDVVRGIEVHRVELAGVGELEDLDDLGRLELDGREVGFLDDHILVFFELVALDDVGAFHGAALGADHLLLEAAVAFLVELVEGNAAGGGRGVVEPDGQRNERQAQVTCPGGTRGHWQYSSNFGRQNRR
jgi:hypothetical protein